MPAGLTNHCDPLFKKHHTSHARCHRSKKPSYFSGEKLNAFLNKDVMEGGKSYRVCDNIFRAIKPVKLPRKATICYPVDTVILSKEEHIVRRRRQQSTFDINKLKKVIVSVDDGCKDEVICFKRVSNISSNRTSYIDGIAKSAAQYYKPFSKVKMRDRRRRMESIAKDVVACCVDRTCFNDNPCLYLKGNTALADEISDFLDGVKESIENHMDVNFVHLDNKAVPLESDETNDDLKRKVEESNGSGDGADKYKAAITILSDTTKSGYHRVLNELKREFKLNALPSFYKLTKNRPAMCELNIEPLPQLNTGNKKISLLSVASEMCAEISEDTALMSTVDGGEILKGGKIGGSCASYISMMASKHSD